MSRNIRQRWNDLPTGGKVIAVGGAGLIAWHIGNLLFGTEDRGGGTSQDIGCGNNVSFTDNQFKVFADGIENAIWGTAWIPTPWEDDQEIADILTSMRTTDDVCHLVRIFGVRYRGIFLNDGGNLVQYIQSYLDADKKRAVNQFYLANNINWVWP